MYLLINKYIEQLLEGLNQELAIQPYINLRRILYETDVSQNIEFQANYKSYWKMIRWITNEDFYNEYFRLMEELKNQENQENLSVEVVVRHLYIFPTDNNGELKLQFSFSSKLVHIIKPSLPIYDSRVSDFYFLPDIEGDIDERIEIFISSYNFLVKEYARILQAGLLNEAIEHFRKHFHIQNEYTDVRTIDTLIWRFVSFARSEGAIRDGIILYE